MLQEDLHVADSEVIRKLKSTTQICPRDACISDASDITVWVNKLLPRADQHCQLYVWQIHIYSAWPEALLISDISNPAFVAYHQLALQRIFTKHMLTKVADKPSALPLTAQDACPCCSCIEP